MISLKKIKFSIDRKNNGFSIPIQKSLIQFEATIHALSNNYRLPSIYKLYYSFIFCKQLAKSRLKINNSSFVLILSTSIGKKSIA